MPERKLGFGLRTLPEEVTCAWGARWIWPADLVWDRTDIFGSEAERDDLVAWLNGGALPAARAEARRQADRFELKSDAQHTVTLFEDERGIVLASPQASYGYLYVAAWLT
jgi:hypothetical protein